MQVDEDTFVNIEYLNEYLKSVSLFNHSYNSFYAGKPRQGTTSLSPHHHLIITSSITSLSPHHHLISDLSPHLLSITSSSPHFLSALMITSILISYLSPHHHLIITSLPPHHHLIITSSSPHHHLISLTPGNLSISKEGKFKLEMYDLGNEFVRYNLGGGYILSRPMMSTLCAVHRAGYRNPFALQTSLCFTNIPLLYRHSFALYTSLSFKNIP